MTISIVRAAPSEMTVRCIECGSLDLAAVCHHCGRGLCELHSHSGAPGSPEFRGLRMAADQKNEEPFHCQDCAHRIVSRSDLVGTAAVLAFLALLALLLPTGSVAFFIISIVIVATGSTAVLLWHRGWSSLQKMPCPCFPRIEHERTVETYVYQAWLDQAGRWQARLQEIHGAARANLRFMPDDVKRVSRYRRRHRIPEGSPVPAHAGFFVAVLRPPFAATGLNEGSSGRVSALPVTTDSARLSYLETGDATFGAVGAEPGASVVPYSRSGAAPLPQSASSVLAWEAQFRANSTFIADKPPIQLIPLLVAEGRRRVLELQVRTIDPTGPTDTPFSQEVTGAGLQPRQIRHLQLDVPMEAGDIVPLGLPPVITVVQTADGGSLRRLRWELADLTSRTGEAPVAPRPNGATESAHFRVEFEHPIPSEAVLRGSVAVVFNGSFAGLFDTVWFDPTGRPADSRISEKFSVVEIQYQFSLASVPYEESLLVIDRNILSNGPIIGRVLADHTTALKVADSLTGSGFYIYSLEESSVSSVTMDAENRIWQLEGRYFDGVAPMDFQLKLEGVDQLRTGGRSASGLNSVTLNIQAMYNSREMRMRFESVAGRIEDVARDALVQCSGLGVVPRLSQRTGSEMD